MVIVKRLLLTATALALTAVAVPSWASAAIGVEIGATKSPLVAPICPLGVSKANCTIILTETTAVEAVSDKKIYPTTVTTAGRIVAFTVGLSGALAKSDIKNLDLAYGKPAEVAITVLKRKKNTFQFTVSAESPVVNVEPYFGHVEQFVLATTLPVVPGDLIALTVPTWAPVLAIDLPGGSKNFRYRASRAKACTSFNVQTAQTKVGNSATYNCFYDSTRVEYTATEIMGPTVGK
jgi:hypothetical protein